MHNLTTSSKLNYYQFDSPAFKDCEHGIFTRLGGVSSSPWDTLNQGGTVGDSRENVVENRKRVFDVFDRPVDSIFDVWQVHGTHVICSDLPRRLEEPHQKADAIFTNNPKLSLFMRFADCVPIMIYDPVKRVIGIIHAGWRGTVDNIIKSSIENIKQEYDVDPKYIIAGIGPSIGPDHYQIGLEVEKEFVKSFESKSEMILEKIDNKIHLNLWAAIEIQLKSAGVTTIENSRICTACHTDEWYSHREEHGKTGRFGAFIALGVK